MCVPASRPAWWPPITPRAGRSTILPARRLPVRSLPLSKHVKHVPSTAPLRGPVDPQPTRPRQALRTTVVLSSVAVAATGVAVTGGVLGGAAPASVGAAAGDRTGSGTEAATPAPPWRGGALDVADRPPADPQPVRRPPRGRRPGQGAGARRGRRPHDVGPREPRRRRPARDRPGAARRVRVRRRPVRLPRLAVHPRVELDRERRQPDAPRPTASRRRCPARR